MILAQAGGFPLRPVLLRHAVSRLGVCLAAAVLVLAGVPSVASAAVTNAALNNQKMLQFMNAERAARGLSPLARDPRLDSLAQSWANKMAADRDMYHPSRPQAVASAGYRSGAQNLAWHDTTLSASWAHNFWMNSSPHRKNILDPAFTHTGLAMACNPSGGKYPYVFATVEFGGSSTPLSSAPPASPHVAGIEAVTGAGCDGSSNPAPAPPPPAPAPPPPPAPAAAPPVAAKASPKSSPHTSAKPSSSSSPAAKKTSPSPPASVKPPASATPSLKPSPSESPPAVLAGGAGSPAPELSGAPAAGHQDLEPAASAGSGRTESRSGALLMLAAGLAGILLMTRIASRNRRVRPKHAISRR